MKTSFLAVIFGATLAASPLSAQNADILLNCSDCHAVAPAAPVAGAPRPRLSPYPDLNGQPARYLERQLYAYAEGLRLHQQMQTTATMLGDGDAAMARLYSDAPAPELQQRQVVDGLTDAITLIEEGDWSRGLPSCASCHSLDPAERGRLAPRLHGQPSTYLAYQLRAYADGTRRSDTMGRMRAFAGQLSSEEISQLAAYYAAWAPSTSPVNETDETPTGGLEND